jgi:predicted DsbA family dithiol-disulfide isomerase
LSTVRTRRLHESFDVELVYTFFPLHPDTPAQGIALRDYFKGRGLDIQEMHRQMRARMNGEGLPYEPGERLINSRLSQELGKWGDQQGKPGIHELLYRAHHAEGTDISDPKALVKIAQKAGLDPVEAQAILSDRRMMAAVDTDWERSREIGVTGVPTFLADGRAVVGAQPYDVLEKLVRLAGAEPRSSRARADQ